MTTRYPQNTIKTSTMFCACWSWLDPCHVVSFDVFKTPSDEFDLLGLVTGPGTRNMIISMLSFSEARLAYSYTATHEIGQLSKYRYACNDARNGNCGEMLVWVIGTSWDNRIRTMKSETWEAQWKHDARFIYCIVMNAYPKWTGRISTMYLSLYLA